MAKQSNESRSGDSGGKTKTIVFTQNAQVRGKRYFTGQPAELDASTADQYVTAGQACDEKDWPKHRANRPKKRLGGKDADTADKTAGEKR